MAIRARFSTSSQTGLTLLELIIVSFILLILSAAAVPALHVVVVRPKEQELRRVLREMRTAIDIYKDYADRNLIPSGAGNEGYPKDLETLVKGELLGMSTQRIRFLRRIPVDPMTGHADWNLQSIQDDPDSKSWGGNNVFDVHSKSQAVALDGTHYSEW